MIYLQYRINTDRGGVVLAFILVSRLVAQFMTVQIDGAASWRVLKVFVNIHLDTNR